MIAFPKMLVSAAKAAKMKVPKDPDEFPKEKYPHFWIFCAIQLARPMRSPGEHWENAKIIAEISEEKLKTMTFADFISAGVQGI